MKLHLIILLWVLLILYSASFSATLTSVTLSNPTVGKYEKLEITVGLTASYSNPFDPSQVDLKSVFTSPSFSDWTIYGFWNGSQWKIRFAGNTSGTWNYTIYLTDSTGTVSTTGTFVCTTSAYPGWVHQSNNNPRYLMYDNGSSYMGLGHNRCWSLQQVPNLFTDMKNFGMNVLVYWLAYWDNPLVTLSTNYDQYDMNNAMDIDNIINSGEQNDVQIMFTVWYHGALRDSTHPWGNEEWSNNPFKNINSVCSTFFFDTTSWRYQENLYRYMLARWGYSRALGYWHTVSEFNGTMAAPNGNTIQAYGDAWHQKITNYFKENDPFRHPITASRGDINSWNNGFQTMDLIQAHSYNYTNDPVREAITVGNWTRSIGSSYTNKPNVMGEFGTNNSSLQPDHIHYSNWAGVLAGAAIGPLDWNDGGSWGDMTQPMFTTMRVLRNYVSDIQFDKLNLNSVVVSAGSGYTGYGLINSATAYFWVMDSTPGEIVTGLTPTIPGVMNGSFLTYWWNTWSGITISVNTSYAYSGNLHTDAPNFQKDIAAKAYWFSIDTSPSPLPTAEFYGTPTTGSGPLLVNFIDQSSNSPNSWVWNFGDGSTSNIQNPTHTYPALGYPTSYSVQLIVTNTYGSDTEVKSNYIHVSVNTALLPQFYELPSLKLFTNQSLSYAFDLEEFQSDTTPVLSYTLDQNFLGLADLSGSTVSQSAYVSATTGLNIYKATNSYGYTSINNKVKYSNYKINKLPKIGLNPGSIINLNMMDYTSSDGALLPPNSYFYSDSIIVSNPGVMSATWSDSSILSIMALSGFTINNPVTVDIIASPGPTLPYGVNMDKERIWIYPNLLTNSTFSASNDTSSYGYELAPNTLNLANIGYLTNLNDSKGNSANGVITFTFLTSNSGIKATAVPASRITYQLNEWYIARMRIYSPDINNSHQNLLFNFSNDAGSGTGHVDVSGYVLFGTPTVWTWIEAPLYSHETGVGYPQFQLKAGGLGSIAIDEIQIIKATPILIDSGRYITRLKYLFGDFDQSSDTTGWGQELYSISSTQPIFNVSNGNLHLDFTGATTGTGQKGIKWTANNGLPGQVYTPFNPVGREIGVQISIIKESGDLNTYAGVILLAALGVSSSGQFTLGSIPSEIIASAEFGRITDGIHRLVGNAVSPYHQFQFGIKNDQSAILKIDYVDFLLDQDDPNYGDSELFP